MLNLKTKKVKLQSRFDEKHKTLFETVNSFDIDNNILKSIKHIKEKVGITLSDLDYADAKQQTFLCHVRALENQALLDYLYQEVVLKNDNYKHDRHGYGRTLLHWAILCNQRKETLQLLIQKDKKQLNAACQAGKTPLQTAAEINNTKALQALLESPEIDVYCRHSDNEKSFLPWILAARNGDIQSLKTFLQHFIIKNDIVGYNSARDTAFYHAVKTGQNSVMDYIIDRHSNSFELMKFFPEPIISYLHVAIAAGQAESVKVLMNNGFDVNYPYESNGQRRPDFSLVPSPLEYAIQHSQEDIALELINRGACLNSYASCLGEQSLTKSPYEQALDAKCYRVAIAIRQKQLEAMSVEERSKDQKLIEKMKQTYADLGGNFLRTQWLFFRAERADAMLKKLEKRANSSNKIGASSRTLEAFKLIMTPSTG